MKVGPYSLVRVIGEGGMGVVYRAIDERSGKLVAVKAIGRPLSTDPHTRRRFLREATSLRRVRHPHVVRVLDALAEGDRSFIVLELLEGETLAAHLDRQGALSPAHTVDLFGPILSAVAAIHRAEIVHRDLKLANVMLARRGNQLAPVVLDFGIARAESDTTEDALTRSGAILGTLRYLSPEQTRNALAASARSDQYALGVMLYECLTGQAPFVGRSAYEVMRAILEGPLTAPRSIVPEIPEELEAVVLRALDRDVSARFSDVAALAAALRPFGGGSVFESTETKAPSSSRRAQLRAGRRFDGERTEVDARTMPPPPALATDAAQPVRRRHTPRWLPTGASLLVLSALAALGHRSAELVTPSSDRAAPAKPNALSLQRREMSGAATRVPQRRSEPAPSTSSSASAHRSKGASPRKKLTEKPLARAPTLVPAPEPGKDDVIDPFAPTPRD